jgi:hypothetical protein
VPSWLDAIEWDAAIKWRIDCPSVVAKYRRFGFDAIFYAIDQINNNGLNSSVHLWLEGDHYLGGRRDQYIDFWNRISQNNQHPIGWIIINETLLDVSPKGRFDLIEQAQIIRGAAATLSDPLVSGIFGFPSFSTGESNFGDGPELPDIDED